MKAPEPKGNQKNRDYFWSGNCLMSSNNDDTFSSSHILEIGEIEPSEYDKKLIASAPEQQEASILLYNLLRKIATVVSKENFDVIRPDWNRAMNAHEQVIRKSTL